MDYHAKYLKYKSKYLALKAELEGGANLPHVIINKKEYLVTLEAETYKNHTTCILKFTQVVNKKIPDTVTYSYSFKDNTIVLDNKNKTITFDNKLSFTDNSDKPPQSELFGTYVFKFDATHDNIYYYNCISYKNKV